jgi:hypothetical protein
MALPVEINPLQLRTSGSYSVSKSLRFRSSASAYLNRTPASATNQKTWTWSCWVKRGVLGQLSPLIAADPNGGTRAYLLFDTTDQLRFDASGVQVFNTSAVYRDPSAWYHVVFALDMTQATAANRYLLYVNGVQITSFAVDNRSSIAQNTNLVINSTVSHNIARDTNTTSRLFDGEMAEVNFIDGQALTPSSFGAYDTNGVWQPAKYSGSYGTNGFYLPFSNTTSTATLGNDSSGNGNTWTVNNVSLTAGATYDSMLDSPTVTSASVANYAVLNPLVPTSLTYSNGNLTETNATANWYNTRATMPFPSTGKIYYEQVCTSGTNCWAGVGNVNTLLTGNPAGYDANSYGYGNSGQKFTNSTGSAYGSSFTTNDVIGVAFDAATGSVWFSKNGVWQNSGVPASGTGYAFTGITGTIFPLASSSGSGATVVQSYNFGQQPFTYTPPTGFVALNTYNLPTPAISNGAKYFAASTYTGNLTGQTITNGGNNTIGTTFQPDLVWIKSRSAATDHKLTDAVRGATKALISDTTGAETTDTTGLTAFASNGFTLGVSTVYNNTGATYAGWQWLANGAGSSNTNGSITSTVSANTTAGFSVVSYSGTAANATVGHGLGAAPNLIITKNRDGVTDWWVYHSSLGATQYLVLDSAAAAVTSASAWNNTAPTSSVFSLGAASPSNANRDIAYCWTAVPGYSAFGSYTGNASTDGPFVYCGFRPRFVLLKDVPDATAWFMFDSSRDTYNVVGQYIQTQSSSAEATQASVDFLSNGFKLRAANDPNRAVQYIYAAFAENPFNSSRAR